MCTTDRKFIEYFRFDTYLGDNCSMLKEYLCKSLTCREKADYAVRLIQNIQLDNNTCGEMLKQIFDVPSVQKDIAQQYETTTQELYSVLSFA